MEIIKRYGQIMACNLKYLLEKSDNEEKIIRVYLREINEEMKKTDMAEKAITEEENKLMGELDSCNNQLSSVEIALKETKDKDSVDRLIAKKETLIRNKNKISKKHDVNSENIKKIDVIKKKLNTDLQFLNGRMEIINSNKEEESVKEEIIEVSGDNETKNIIYNILSKLERHEKKSI